MKNYLLLLLFVFMILPTSAELRGGSGTDIDNYTVAFTQNIIDTLKSIYGRWETAGGGNKYRVMTLGNSNTNDSKHWEPLNWGVTGLTNSAEWNSFKDSTFALNSWLERDSCKTSAHGNEGGITILQLFNYVVPAVAADKPMIAPIMIGTNNVHHASRSYVTTPDTVEMNYILSAPSQYNVMPIITSIPPVNDQDASWGEDHDGDALVNGFNEKLRLFAEGRGLPFLDINKWCMDHGGTGLLTDWAHSNSCGSSVAADFSDNCLSGGDGGSFQNARNYLLAVAIQDIIKYVVEDEPFIAIEETETLSSSDIGISVSPNPFNPSTVVTVQKHETRDTRHVKSKSKAISVQVYNLRGRQIKTLSPNRVTKNSAKLNGHVSRVTFFWSASSQPSGVYIIKATIGNRVLTKKITLLR